jgi:hypothetical protein
VSKLKRCGAILFVVLILGFVVLWSPAAWAIESFGVGARPANPRADNPRTESIFIYNPSPGQVVEDAVKVINNTDKTKTIAITAVDSIISSDGAFGCAQAVDDKKDVGGWITLSKQEVVLPAGGTEVVPFTMTVPSKVDVGEHNGCIAVQDMTATQNAGNGIVLSFRSALRVAVTIPGEIVKDLRFMDIATQLKADKLVITPTLKNVGNVSLDTEVSVSAKKLLGADLNDKGKFPILAKATSKFNFELDRPYWGGWYKVSTAADYAQLSGAADESSQFLAGPSKMIFIPPQPVALLIEIATVLLVGGTIGFFIWRWRSRKQMMMKTRTYTVARGEHIETIAATHGIRWQLLAKLNHLKPPYRLSPGQQLRIPRKKTKR